MSIDRLLIFKTDKWRTVYFTRKIAVSTGIALSLLIYLINLNVVFTYGFILTQNGSSTVQCYTTVSSTKWMNVWNSVYF
jgi:hypothetical protein